jgi:hypothetical protein
MDEKGLWLEEFRPVPEPSFPVARSAVEQAFASEIVKPKPEPSQCDPWPPSQHLLDSFRYEVGGKLFTLYRHHGVERVQLKMSHSSEATGIIIECVATIGQKIDTLVNCEFEHISAVAAAIPRAEVFLRNLHEPKSPSIPNVVPPNGCYWDRMGNAVFLRRESDGVVLSSVPESVDERDAMLACVEAFDPKMTGSAMLSGHGVGIIDIPRGLGRGNYAVSFRKLPDGK